jgi:hypothetical protein
MVDDFRKEFLLGEFRVTRKGCMNCLVSFIMRKEEAGPIFLDS